MNQFEVIKSEWMTAYQDVFNKSQFRDALESGFKLESYKEILKQIYYHARENPQIQVLATVYFRGQQREMIKNFYRHALAEIGHDQLALNDLQYLGEDTTRLPAGRPLPATTALLSYPFYQIQFQDPVGYLGYLFHLEFMPTQFGEDFMKAFRRAEIPDGALTFVKEHLQVDQAHNRMMEEYVENLVFTEESLESVIYASAVTAGLYINMLDQAIEAAAVRSPRLYREVHREVRLQ